MAQKLKGYKLLYSPSGRAGEYANHGYAANLYHGCQHGCQYCFVPACKRTTPDIFHATVTPQKDVLKRLEHDVQIKILDEPIFMSFSCDPYPPDDKLSLITRQAIQIIIASGNRVNILTKGGARALRDLDLMALVPGNKLGTTLTFSTTKDSRLWEPAAALPCERLEMIEKAFKLGIYTWVSMEPVIIPEQTLELIDRSHRFVNEFRVGKWNHDNRAKSIDWKDFYDQAKMKLDHVGAKYILKDDLLKAAGGQV